MGSFDTIVIGAGMSGVTAARMLADAGHRVVVLEDASSIGGRMHTDREAGFPVDRGASWIHGIDGSPLWDLVQALRIPTIEYTVGKFPGRRAAHRELRRRRKTHGLRCHRSMDRRRRRGRSPSRRRDRRLLPGDTYLDVTERALDRSGLSPDRIDDIREFFRHRVEEQCGAWIGDLDAHGLDEDAIDGDEVIFPHGYDEVPRRIGAGLDIRFETTATKIVRSTGGVTVHAGDTAFTADQVVVTVPWARSRQGSIEFEPALPEAVAGPVARLGMGVFNKVFIQFDQRFWNEDSYVLRALGEAGEHWHSWYDVSAVSGLPTPADLRRRDRSDGECRSSPTRNVVADAVRALTRALRRRGRRAPGALGHAMGDDEFSNGSYSYLALGSTHHDHDDLAGPVDGVLHFAGEATWGDEPATVGGRLLLGAPRRGTGAGPDSRPRGFAARIIEREQKEAR